MNCASTPAASAQERIPSPPTVQSASYSVPIARPPEPNQASELNSAAPTGRRITPQGQSSSQSRTRSGSPVTTFIALLVVIGVIALVYRLIKRSGGIRSGLPSEAVKVLGHKVLAHRQAIQLVRVGTRILILNSSADGLSTLSEITAPIEVAALEHSCRLTPPSKSVAEIFAPQPKTTARGSRRDARTIRGELQRDPLVVCYSLIFGYTDLSLMRASSTFICQSTPR